MKHLQSNYSNSCGFLVLGIIAQRPCFESPEYHSLLKHLSAHFGRIDRIIKQEYLFSAPLSYETESGRGLHTEIVVLEKIGSFWDCLRLKKFSENIELELSINGQRKYNINPGILCRKGLYLASHKTSPRREYLAANVWVEKQYRNGENGLTTMKNTFPEYRERTALSLLNELTRANKAMHSTDLAVPNL
jgi:hypothetical protein